jgi:hypothetical protein
MRALSHTVRIFLVAVGILVAAPDLSRAQAPWVSPAAATPLMRDPVGRDLRVPRVDLFELSRYAGWGATIGAGVGLAYGLAFERGQLKPALVVADMYLGFGIGLAAGTLVYVAKLALGR